VAILPAEAGGCRSAMHLSYTTGRILAKMHRADTFDIPRILIAALRGGSGKTVISIGMIAALARSGKTVAPFKKGPDYIDAGWLAMAAGRPCHNLDAFLCDDRSVVHSFLHHSHHADIAVIEGNRGLYDGLDAAGTTSSAALARLLSTPVILCIDCTKSTRTMAALVMGCMQFDPAVDIAGVILNRVAGHRHENLLRKTIETYCKIPVVGAVPKLPGADFPERHMGLIPTPEHAWAAASIESAAKVADNHIDLEAVCRIARTANAFEYTFHGSTPESRDVHSISDRQSAAETPSEPRPRIGVLKDAAFQFYYPENLDALADAGADVLFISPLASGELPEVDALYIGGGFPETHAEALSENRSFCDAVCDFATRGFPIYAECGGLMYLGESLVLDQVTYPMAGVLPVVFGFSKRPQGHGYTVVTVNRDNPFFPGGMELKGHEFHYSRVIKWKGGASDLVFDMKKGRGLIDCGGIPKDGLCIGNVMATYTHLHALGCPHWAHSLVRLSRACRDRDVSDSPCDGASSVVPSSGPGLR